MTKRKYENYDDPVLNKVIKCIKYNPRISNIETIALAIGVLVAIIDQAFAPLPKPVLWCAAVCLVVALILGAYRFIVKDGCE